MPCWSWRIFEGSAEVGITHRGQRADPPKSTTSIGNIDAVTDVLSFPLGENGQYDVNPETGAKMLGDIVLSMERARGAGRSSTAIPFSGKSGILTVHSMLHLLGYDHVDGGLEAVRMREREEAVMASVGLPRGESYVMLGNGK